MSDATNALLSALQGASNAAASNVTGPVDMLAWALRKAGVPVPSNPIFGEEWMRQKGLLAEPQNRLAGLLGEGAGLAAPFVVAAKAPQIARGLLATDDALTAGANRMADHFQQTGAAYKYDPKQRGAFMGANSKTWDAASNAKAVQMEAAGTDPRVIWKETGNWKGPDGKWRQEIDDRFMSINKEKLDLGMFKDNYDLGPITEGLVNHKQLKNAYGGLTDETYIEGRKAMGGYYDPMANAVSISHTGSLPRAKSAALHEIQHAIQRREGFARGGGADMAALDPRVISKEISADDFYKRLAGEAEARAVQARMEMFPLERRQVFPADSYDVPIRKLILDYQGPPNALVQALKGPR